MVKQMLAPDLAQKMLCIIVPNRRTASPEFFFVSSYTTAINSITACLAHAPKKCMQSGNFHFDINSPFQNTFYPKTTHAFPKKYKLELTSGIHACIDHAFVNIREIRCHDSWQPRKRRMKSEFAFFQSLSWLFQIAQVFSSWILPHWRNTSLEQILVIFLQTADKKSSSENQLKVVKQPFLINYLSIFFEDKGLIPLSSKKIDSQITVKYHSSTILIEETKLPRKHSLCIAVINRVLVYICINYFLCVFSLTVEKVLTDQHDSGLL